mmetsp:Transcript_12441/g.57603  ORF Transcript_12441/g.57603 Transcript_12441/m.57603 type:complete len:256 (+) Transcript_12441:166-933(+)
MVGLPRADAGVEGLGRHGDVEALRVDHARPRRAVCWLGVLLVAAPAIGPGTRSRGRRHSATGPHRRDPIFRNDADVAPAREDRPGGWTRDQRHHVGLRARRHDLLAARDALHARTRAPGHHPRHVRQLPTQLWFPPIHVQAPDAGMLLQENMGPLLEHGVRGHHHARVGMRRAGYLRDPVRHLPPPAPTPASHDGVVGGEILQAGRTSGYLSGSPQTLPRDRRRALAGGERLEHHRVHRRRGVVHGAVHTRHARR